MVLNQYQVHLMVIDEIDFVRQSLNNLRNLAVLCSTSLQNQLKQIGKLKKICLIAKFN